MTVAKNSLWNTVASLLTVGVLSATLAAQPTSAARYDNQIQTAVTQRLAAKKQFSDVKSKGCESARRAQPGHSCGPKRSGRAA